MSAFLFDSCISCSPSRLTLPASFSQAKKSPATKATAQKKSVKKSPADKATAVKQIVKSPAKVVVKQSVKKSPAKKSPAKKATVVKKSVKKSPTKKAKK